MTKFNGRCKRWYKNIELRKKLLVSYAFFFTIILFAATIFQYKIAEKYLRNKILVSNTETIDQTIQTLNQYFKDVNEYLFNLGTNTTLQTTLSSDNAKTSYQSVMEADQLVANVLNTDTFFSKTAGVYIYANKKSLYPTYSRSAITLASGQSEDKAFFRTSDILNDDWYKESIDKKGQISWRSPEWDNVRNKNEFSATKMIIDTKNLKNSLGVIRVFISEKYIQDLLNNVTLSDKGKVYLCCNGNIINYTDEGSVDDINEQMALNDESIRSAKIGKENCYIVSRNTSIPEWKLIGLIPASSIDYQLILLKNVAIILLVIGITITFLISILIAASISRPIRKVADAMKSYEKNRDIRFDDDRKDEVGTLYTNYNRMMDEIADLLRKVKKGEEDKRKAELHALQEQINPHFLYNTLDCITSYAYLKHSNEIAELTLSLSEFFRISLNKGNEHLPLQRELDHVQSYCNIQKYRYPDKFMLFIEVPDELKKIMVIKMILQPIVENSIVHGFKEMKKGGIIRISANGDKNNLFLLVMDNGENGDVEYMNGILSGEYKYIPADTKGSGYGIKNVNDRLKLSYGKESGLSYSENTSGLGITAIIHIVFSERNENGQQDQL